MLLKSAQLYGKSPYGKHLKNVADDKLLYVEITSDEDLN